MGDVSHPSVLSRIKTGALTLVALTLGAGIGFGFNAYQVALSVFSPQQRVALQNERANGATTLIGGEARADATGSGGGSSGSCGGPACSACACTGACTGSCGCSNGCGACGGGCGGGK